MKADKYDKRIDAIAQRIKELRIAAGYTSYEDFAVKNDLDRKQYWRMEKGQNFNIKSLLKIADALNITMEEFWKGLK